MNDAFILHCQAFVFSLSAHQSTNTKFVSVDTHTSQFPQLKIHAELPMEGV